MKASQCVIGALLIALAATVQATELKSVEQLTNVRGSIVFRTYCVLCHGEKADGKGRAAKNLNPPPANLTISLASDDYKEMIIRKGGAAVGRSPYMPPWGYELSDEQIKDVIAFLRVININSVKQKE